MWPLKRSKPSRPKEVCFLHVPKTGGTFVGQLESDGDRVVQPMTYLGHVIPIDQDFEPSRDLPRPLTVSSTVERAALTDKVVFSNVRNIFSLLVSYSGHAGGRNPRYDSSTHYDFAIAGRGFDYLVRAIADRDDMWPSRKFLYCWLFSQPSGDFVPDWLNNVDVLDADLQAMAKQYSLKHNSKERQRLGNINDYRSMFTDSLVGLIEDTWSRELKVFGFEFEDRAKWHGRKKVMDNLRGSNYIWHSDQFQNRSNSLVRNLFRLKS